MFFGCRCSALESTTCETERLRDLGSETENTGLAGLVAVVVMVDATLETPFEIAGNTALLGLVAVEVTFDASFATAFDLANGRGGGGIEMLALTSSIG